ncbi:multifunctional methyltransferase subunit TRM112-like protein [Octopus bimaculoides]|uniref:Multifunctional methyltransferase subunit TRM112-like protein n=1 Tax=Octopus bimaculoides TaxID=37653 RepID=A0A0L8GX18_OCTBM|nr:multifunctional methyltransferase subunit TRM112-like protein [Octopus bimaculoides]|eukprot:XP_014777274.1 PREDICTED: multifunctional methyltransferase subunit TRM112-like protein [Octopus bimaculoides]
MKLLTHNMLTSTIIKGVLKGYPLGITAKKLEIKEAEFNKEFICRMISKVDWSALYAAVTDVGHPNCIPQTLLEDFENNDEFLKKVHHALIEIEVDEGELICPETGRKFTIKNGIPNMLLNEDEV